MSMDQRDRLIEAAIRCLQERGYAHTTTRDIVAAAGAHLPAVNYYFGSKEELLKAAITRALRTWTESVMAVTEDAITTANPQDRLRGAMGAFLGSLEENRGFAIAAVEAFAQASRGDGLREHLADEYQLARDAIAERIPAVAGKAADGQAPPADDDVQSLASVLLALFDGLTVQWLMAPGRIPDADQIVRALALVSAAPDTSIRGEDEQC
ncbi:TetR/AcrR family transcriptional regulator [Nocardiopsis gilva]|uniref:TetR/AcrR family transcriptional regulator n=1 Tax=Nocardiopsis gilva TaxID=280236 RepID=UPI000370C174|nr:TetR/AcrR family transcriptional regulator [Nocardiopsis gilva]